MARKKRTDEFELLCGYLEPPAEEMPREEGESHRDWLERTHTLHKTIKVCELDHCLDQDLANREVDAVDLLARHVVQVGTITDPRVLRDTVVPKLLKGDYDYSLMRDRMLTLGDIYEYKRPCPSCNEENDLEVDLSEIETIDMPDPYDRLLSLTTDDGITMEFRNLDATDVDHLADVLEDQQDEIRQMLGLRLVSIDGITPRKALADRGRLGKDKDKEPTPEQHTREAVRLLEKYEINHREREEVRSKLKKMIGYPKLLTKDRCKFCRRTWKHIIQMEPSFFKASSED